VTDANDPTVNGSMPVPHSRRSFLKGALGAGAAATALAAFGDGLVAPMAGVSAQSDEMLPASKFTIKNTLALNLTRHFATVPLFQGMFNGQPVWYVITEASDQGIASDRGLNFSPRLANIPAGHPAVQEVVTGNPSLGRDMATFAGVPNFGPTRVITAGPMGFPPANFSPGSYGMGMYADFVRVRGNNVVYNAPIIAVGSGPFDVTTHTNTHDRVLSIDTAKMTVDLLFVRAFAHGREIMYHSFSASEPMTAAIERGTYVPALSLIPTMNTRTVPEGARSSIFAFVNGKLGLTSPPAQGLNHVILDGHNPEDASMGNVALLKALSMGGDARNVLDSFPTLNDPRLYTPVWDLQLAKWSKDAMAQGMNIAQTDANQIRQLASQGLVTAPDELPITEQNIIINCPALAFTTDAPSEPQALDPGRSATVFRGAP